VRGDFLYKPEIQGILLSLLLQAPFIGYSQFPAATLAAAGKYFAAGNRFHAAAKAVFVLTYAAGRLVCAFLRHSSIN
jgi:hypothetical protein